MHIVLARNWWSLVLRGIIAIVAGIVTIIWPGITVAGLIILFGAYSLLDGVMSVLGAVRAAESHERWGVLVLEGVVGIAAAVVTVLWPAITLLALVWIIAAWAVVTGVFEIVAAVRLRRYIQREWLLVLSGIVSVLFGVIVAALPLAGALVIALWIGAYMLIFGILLLTLGLRLRHWGNATFPHSPMPAPAH